MTKLEKLITAAGTLLDGVNADIWYDARQFGDETAQEAIDRTMDAMTFIYDTMPTLVSIIEAAQNLVKVKDRYHTQIAYDRLAEEVRKLK